MTKFHKAYVCKYCGSVDVLVDAYASWDIETQRGLSTNEGE